MSESIQLFASIQELEHVLAERKIARIRVNRTPFCITRLGREVFLFETNCPHFDYPLSEAHISPLGEVVCPWHNYRFTLQGGVESRDRCRALRVFSAFWNDEGALMVNL